MADHHDRPSRSRRRGDADGAGPVSCGPVLKFWPTQARRAFGQVNAGE